MPSSVRFVLILLVLATIGAAVSIFMIYYGDDRQARITAEQLTGGSVAAGKRAVDRYGCATCHEIASVSGLQGRVGPPLKGIAVRALIAGYLPNRPDQMIRWIRHPQEVLPGNGMPDQGIGDRDARDIAAYLYTLKD